MMKEKKLKKGEKTSGVNTWQMIKKLTCGK